MHEAEHVGARLVDGEHHPHPARGQARQDVHHLRRIAAIQACAALPAQSGDKEAANLVCTGSCAINFHRCEAGALGKPCAEECDTRNSDGNWSSVCFPIERHI